MKTIPRRTFLRFLATSLVAGSVSSLLVPILSGTVKAANATERDEFCIAVLSDLHIQWSPHRFGKDSSNQKAQRAIEDMLGLKPDLLVIIGDITQHGLVEEYEIASKLLESVHDREIPVLVSMGNHEFYNPTLSDAQCRDLFMKQFGLRSPYSHAVINGLHFLTLSPEYRSGPWPEREWARLTERQLLWFDHALATHPNKPAFVFLHQPLNDTVEQSQYDYESSRTVQSEQLLSIAKKHPQIQCWFSGHTHAPLRQARQIVKKRGIVFVGGASTFFTDEAIVRNIETGGQRLEHIVDYHANENRFVIIRGGKIIIRARDHTQQRWLPNLDYSVSLRNR